MTRKFNKKKEIFKDVSFLQIKSDYFNKHSWMWTASKKEKEKKKTIDVIYVCV